MTSTQYWLRKNPLVEMGVRRRLRTRNMVTAGAITLVINAFIYLIVFLTSTERGYTDAENAAKLAFVPILVFQAFVLMFMGTGAVASGIAEEKEGGLLDYHRMTPMTPTSKIIGYLIGFPIREYFMFALTIPFMGFSVIVGGIALFEVLQLYLVFFTSVVLYHLAGMVAGMIAHRPRRAAAISRVIVVVLYLILPQLGKLGISFLGYLTVVPVFNGLLRGQVQTSGVSPEVAQAISEWRDVPIFWFRLSPTLFTLMVQGVLLVTFFVIVHRKWLRDGNQALSKVGAVVLYGAVQLLLLGSLWPYLSGGQASLELMARFQGLANGGDMTILLLVLHFAVSGGVALLLTMIFTPDTHQVVRGVRRAKKLGLPRVPLRWDERTGWWAPPVPITDETVPFGIEGTIPGGVESHHQCQNLNRKLRKSSRRPRTTVASVDVSAPRTRSASSRRRTHARGAASSVSSCVERAFTART